MPMPIIWEIKRTPGLAIVETTGIGWSEELERQMIQIALWHTQTAKKFNGILLPYAPTLEGPKAPIKIQFQILFKTEDDLGKYLLSLRENSANS